MTAFQVAGLQAVALASLAWAALVPMKRRQQNVQVPTTAQEPRTERYNKTGVVVALPSNGWNASGVVLLWILIRLAPTGTEARQAIAPSLSVFLWRAIAVALSGLTVRSTRHRVTALTRGGPLGSGCSKVWEALVGIGVCHNLGSGGWSLSLLSYFDHQGASSDHGAASDAAFHSVPPSTFLAWGQPIYSQHWIVWLGLAILCLAVNGVLWAWSVYHTIGTTGRRGGSTNHANGPHHNQTTPRFDHSGVVHMVQDSVGRPLKAWEHLQLVGLALVNAVCEEVSFRGAYRWHFAILLPLSAPLWHSNVCQATIFGIWHYHGIPSGLVGVGLTFVYGIIMGWLADSNDGLGLAIVAHTLADYYIFATIARKQQQQPSPKGVQDKQD